MQLHIFSHIHHDIIDIKVASEVARVDLQHNKRRKKDIIMAMMCEAREEATHYTLSNSSVSRLQLITIFIRASNYIIQGDHQRVLHDVRQQGTKRAPVGVGPQGAHRAP